MHHYKNLIIINELLIIIIIIIIIIILLVKAHYVHLNDLYQFLISMGWLVRWTPTSMKGALSLDVTLSTANWLL